MERYWGVDPYGNPYPDKQGKGHLPPSTSKPLDRYNPLLAMSVRRWMKNRGKTVKPKLTEEQTANLQMCFKMMDADGSGAIDADELHAAFKLLGLKTTKKEVEAMLDEVDRDGSGEVEWAEFLEIMTVQLHKMAEGQNERRTSSPDGEETDEEGSAGKEGDKSAPDAAALPFDIVATAYRRKKLLEALDQDNKQFLREVAEEEERRAAEVVASPGANSSKASLEGAAQEESSFANNYAANMGALLSAETNEQFLHLMAKDQKKIVGTLLNRFRESQEAARAAVTAQGQQRRKPSPATKALGGLAMRVAQPVHGGVHNSGSLSPSAGHSGSRPAALAATSTSDWALGASVSPGSPRSGRLAGRPLAGSWQPGVAVGQGKGEGAEGTDAQSRSAGAAWELEAQQGWSTGAASLPQHVAASDWQEEQQLADSFVHELAVDEVVEEADPLDEEAAHVSVGVVPAVGWVSTAGSTGPGVGWVVPAAGGATLWSPTTTNDDTRLASPLHDGVTPVGVLGATVEEGDSVGSALEGQSSAAEAAASELGLSSMLVAAHWPPSRKSVVAKASGEKSVHLSPRDLSALQQEGGAKRAASPHVRFADAVYQAENGEDAVPGEEALGGAAEERSQLEAGAAEEMSGRAHPHQGSLRPSPIGRSHRSIIAFRRASAADLDAVYNGLQD